MDNISLVNWDNINQAGKTWKEWCKYCKKFHYVTLQPCPDCGVHYIPQPKSEKVNDECRAPFRMCDGCEAYQDHYTI